MQAALRKHSARLRLASLAVLGASLVVLMRGLPLGAGAAALEVWVAGLGALGPLVFGLVYVLAALLCVPGAVLTLAAGALFGPLVGTLTVSVASTAAASLAALIARHGARERVARWARKDPRFLAIDRAIEQGGARVVALLRLSPVLPFSIGNYLFGLTGVRFGPYVLASWLCMLPGTFLYVYLGHAGRHGLAAAAGAGSKNAGEWALLGVGLAATVVVTVYVARLARRALAEQTDLGEAPAAPAPEPPAPTWPRGTLALAALALVALGGALWSALNPAALRGLFGPPRVALVEAYAVRGSGETFEHAALDALLRAHVDARGLVDYAALRARAAELDAYLAEVAAAPFGALGRDEKLALLLNLYNAATLRTVLEHPGVDSIRRMPGAWTDARWNVAGRTLSLEQLEHDELRAKFVEPRVHFALVCAALGCPPLRAEAYSGARLEEQLADQTRRVHTSARWVNDVGVTALYDWYRGDFEQVHGTLVAALAAYGVQRDDVTFLPYDWTLNDARFAQRLEVDE